MSEKEKLEQHGVKISDEALDYLETCEDVSAEVDKSEEEKIKDKFRARMPNITGELSKCNNSPQDIPVEAKPKANNFTPTVEQANYPEKADPPKISDLVRLDRFLASCAVNNPYIDDLYDGVVFSSNDIKLMPYENRKLYTAAVQIYNNYKLLRLAMVLENPLEGKKYLFAQLGINYDGE